MLQLFQHVGVVFCLQIHMFRSEAVGQNNPFILMTRQ
jgi:hypothetical protein